MEQTTKGAQGIMPPTIVPDDDSTDVSIDYRDSESLELVITDHSFEPPSEYRIELTIEDLQDMIKGLNNQ